MSVTTAELLAVSPEEAVVMMFNDAYGQKLPLKLGRVVNAVFNPDNSVTVTLGVRDPESLDETLPFKNTVTFTYPRVSPNDVVGAGGFQVNVPALPTTAQTFADEFAARFGILADPGDFIIEEYLPGSFPDTYHLIAAPTSLRWYGELTVTVGP